MSLQSPVNEQPKVTPAKVAKLVVGIIITVVFLYLTLSKVSWSEAVPAFKRVNFLWVLFGLLSLAVAYVLRIFRSYILYKSTEQPPTLTQCIRPYLASIALNNVLPFRAGDAARIFAYSAEIGLKPTQVLVAMLIERILDLCALCLIFAASAGGAKIAPPLDNILRFAIPIAAAGGLFILLLPLISNKLASHLDGSPSAIKQKLANIFNSIPSVATFAKLASISLIAWAFEGAMFVCAARGLALDTSFLAGWFAAASATLSTLLPSSPGYIGTFHFFAGEALRAYGVEQTSSVVFAIITHLMVWLPLTLIGGLLIFLKPSKS